MKGFIDEYNFAELECQKYWAPPSTWTDEKKKTEVRNRIFSGEWLGAQKRDGALYVFLKDEDGNITLRGRSKSVSGVYLDKWELLPHLHSWGDYLPNGTCFIGEVYWPGNEGAKNTTSIMNCLPQKAIDRQKEEKNKLHYYIFDVLAFDGTSWLDMAASDRFSLLWQLHMDDSICPYVEYATYKRGQDLWEMLQQLLSDGYEGIVITHESAKYEPGKRPSRTMKVKQELKQTVDCIVMGANPPTRLYTGKSIETWPYWVDMNTDERLEEDSHYRQYCEGAAIFPATKNYYFKWAGSLRLGLVRDGKVEYFGDLSGLTEEVLANWQDYRGKVCEVGGMMIDPESGHIRHPKLIGWRDDKRPADCTWDQVLL